jgi:diamine N-acetyltransferase
MPKRAIDPIAGDRVLLRLLKEEDLPRTLEWRNQDHIRRWFFHSDVIRPEQHEGWFRRYLERDDDFVFIIEETRDLQRPVGQVSIYNVDWPRRRAEYGRLILGEAAARGRGLARDATRALVDWALGSLGLEEIYLEVFTHNIPAIAIYQRCGFEETARDGRIVCMTRRAERA